MRLPEVKIFNFLFKVTGWHIRIVEYLVVALRFFVIYDTWPINVLAAGFTFEILIWISLHFWAGFIIVIIARIRILFMFEAVVPIYVVSPERIIVIEVCVVLMDGFFRFLAVVVI